MKFKKVVGALAVMLAMTTVACGGDKSAPESTPAQSTPTSEPAPISSEPAPVSSEATPTTSEVTPVSSEVTPTTSEVTPAAHTHTLEAVAHDKGTGEVTEEVKKVKMMLTMKYLGMPMMPIRQAKASLTVNLVPLVTGSNIRFGLQQR